MRATRRFSRARLKSEQEGYLPPGAVKRFIDEAKGAVPPEPAEPEHQETILVSSRKKPIHARSENQKKYVDAIKAHDIVFGIGPAGTGKTWLAVAHAFVAAAPRRITHSVGKMQPTMGSIIFRVA